MIDIRKILKRIMKFLPHINIVIAFTMITLFVTDRYNRAMKFLYNDNTKWLLLIFCISVILQSVIQVYLNRCAARERNARAEQEASKPNGSSDWDY